MHKRIALKGVLKFTLKELQHVSVIITIIRERAIWACESYNVKTVN